MAARARADLSLRAHGISVAGRGVDRRRADVEHGDRSRQYDPVLFAIGIATLFAFACTFMAYLVARNRMWRNHARKLEERFERNSDQLWQLQEAEQRARAFLESQSDLIVRRRRIDPLDRFRQRRLCSTRG